MFTGIVTAIGTIREVSDRGDLRAVIACPFDPAEIAIGASIACSGVCLTVVDRGGEPGDAWFAVDVSGETVSRTPPGLWRHERRLNLEQALQRVVVAFFREEAFSSQLFAHRYAQERRLAFGTAFAVCRSLCLGQAPSLGSCVARPLSGRSSGNSD
jgi:hypothetical protein